MFSHNNTIEKNVEIKGLRLILGYLGLLTGLVGIVILLPVFYIIFDSAEWKYTWYFLGPALVFIVAGFTLFFALIYKKKHGRLANHQDAFIVVSCWLIAILGTSSPFWLSGKLNFHQALFEVTSGWTTTGLSVFDVEAANVNSFLLARTFTMLFGGIGIVLIMISIFSDRYGMRLYSAEGHYDRFVPNLLRSSRKIVIIYLGIILAGIIGYLSFGMNFYDAFSHSITAVATGGFSTHAESIGYFNISVTGSMIKTCGIQIVTIVLMLVGSISFISWALLFKGKFKSFFSNCENKMQLAILSISIPLLIIATLTADVVISKNDTAMNSIFHAVSALTTSGFQLQNFTALTAPAILIILTILMMFGGQTNSTAGGIKIFRIHLFFRSIGIKIRNTFSPLNTRHPDRVSLYDGDLYLDTSILHENNLFILSSISVFLTGVMIFAFSGVSLGQAMFETASMIGTVGLSTGLITQTSPTYYYYVSSILMILGRLEIFVIIYAMFYAVSRPVQCLRNLVERRR